MTWKAQNITVEPILAVKDRDWSIVRGGYIALRLILNLKQLHKEAFASPSGFYKSCPSSFLAYTKLEKKEYDRMVDCPQGLRARQRTIMCNFIC